MRTWVSTDAWPMRPHGPLSKFTNLPRAVTPTSYDVGPPLLHRGVLLIHAPSLDSLFPAAKIDLGTLNDSKTALLLSHLVFLKQLRFSKR